MSEKRVLLVVDVSNLYYSINRMCAGARLRYEKLLEEVNTYGFLYRAIAYGSSREGENDGFKYALTQMGFELRYKEPKTYYDPTAPDKQRSKADWDVGIAVEVIEILDSVDIVVFATADGDLAPAVRYVQNHGKLAYVIGCKVSNELKGIADKCIEVVPSMLRETVKEAV